MRLRAFRTMQRCWSPVIWYRTTAPVICAFAASSATSRSLCCVSPAITTSPRPCAENSKARRFRFAVRTRRKAGNSSCSTATTPATSAGACGRTNPHGPPRPHPHRPSTRWSVCIITPSPWAAAGWTPWASLSRKRSGASSIPTPTSVPWCGDTSTRRTMAGAATCACSRLRRPAPSSCPRAIGTRSIRGRPRTGISTCMPMAASTPRFIGSSRCRCASHLHARPTSRLGLILLGLLLCITVRADGALHSLWELHGKHNTVYLLGSIHVLRPNDYPLAPVVLDAYTHAGSLLMEVNLDEINSEQVQAEMLASAILSDGKTLPDVLGKQRYERAAALAHEIGVELSKFDQFAPWFAAEAISELQLTQLGFQPENGVEMYFMDRAHSDGKSVDGLETVHDQISVFQNMSLDAQAEYLLSSLEQAHDLPKEVDSMVRAWQRGDTRWFESELQSDLGHDPDLYQSVLLARNRKWVPKIEALLNSDKNYLVIVGTGHLAGRGSVVDLLKKDGIVATQR